ncbi:MAG: hypothetical protein U5K69_01660 [Balneolaceae bacterium]|nr:hypothetical protein [Balneolaceae bacterium]
MYVLDYHKQIALIKEMVQLRKDNTREEAYYHHPSTNAIWKSYFPQANGGKRGPKVLRRTDIDTDKLEDQIRLCLGSDLRDDAAGLGVEFSVHPERWEQILDIIEEHYQDFIRSQIKVFFQHLGILDYEEFFAQMEFNFEQIGIDESELKALNKRARKILLKKLVFFW